MQQPIMIGAHPVAHDVTCLSSYFPLPGLGILPVNAFVIHASEPVLVDTGLSILREPFLRALGEVIDPADLRWIWMSHMDADHLGNLEAVLAIAPHARIATTFLGMGKMLLREMDVSRVHLLEPGASLEVDDRKLVSVQPAYYDAPETQGFLDTRTRVLFSGDAFGALLQEPAEAAAAIPEGTLRSGMLAWAAIDAPWLAIVDDSAFGRVLSTVRRLDPAAIVSGHLPVAQGITDRLLALCKAATQAPAAAADRAEIEALMSA